MNNKNKKVDEKQEFSSKKQEFSSEEIKEMYKKAKEEVGGYSLKTFERALEIYQKQGEISDEELDKVAGGVNRKTLSLALAGIAAIAAGFGIAGSQQASAVGDGDSSVVQQIDSQETPEEEECEYKIEVIGDDVYVDPAEDVDKFFVTDEMLDEAFSMRRDKKLTGSVYTNKSESIVDTSKLTRFTKSTRWGLRGKWVYFAKKAGAPKATPAKGSANSSMQGAAVKKATPAKSSSTGGSEAAKSAESSSLSSAPAASQTPAPYVPSGAQVSAHQGSGPSADPFGTRSSPQVEVSSEILLKETKVAGERILKCFKLEDEHGEDVRALRLFDSSGKETEEAIFVPNGTLDLEKLFKDAGRGSKRLDFTLAKFVENKEYLMPIRRGTDGSMEIDVCKDNTMPGTAMNRPTITIKGTPTSDFKYNLTLERSWLKEDQPSLVNITCSDFKDLQKVLIETARNLDKSSRFFAYDLTIKELLPPQHGVAPVAQPTANTVVGYIENGFIIPKIFKSEIAAFKSTPAFPPRFYDWQRSEDGKIGLGCYYAARGMYENAIEMFENRDGRIISAEGKAVAAYNYAILQEWKLYTKAEGAKSPEDVGTFYKEAREAAQKAKDDGSKDPILSIIISKTREKIEQGREAKDCFTKEDVSLVWDKSQAQKAHVWDSRDNERLTTLSNDINYIIRGYREENAEISDIQVRSYASIGYLRLLWADDRTSVRIMLADNPNFENFVYYDINRVWPGFNQTDFMKACGKALVDSFISRIEPNIEAIVRKAYEGLAQQAQQAQLVAQQRINYMNSIGWTHLAGKTDENGNVLNCFKFGDYYYLSLQRVGVQMPEEVQFVAPGTSVNFDLLFNTYKDQLARFKQGFRLDGVINVTPNLMVVERDQKGYVSLIRVSNFGSDQNWHHGEITCNYNGQNPDGTHNWRIIFRRFTFNRDESVSANDVRAGSDFRQPEFMIDLAQQLQAHFWEKNLTMDDIARYLKASQARRSVAPPQTGVAPTAAGLAASPVEVASQAHSLPCYHRNWDTYKKHLSAFNSALSGTMTYNECANQIYELRSNAVTLLGTTVAWEMQPTKGDAYRMLRCIELGLTDGAPVKPSLWLENSTYQVKPETRKFLQDCIGSILNMQTCFDRKANPKNMKSVIAGQGQCVSQSESFTKEQVACMVAGAMFGIMQDEIVPQDSAFDFGSVAARPELDRSQKGIGQLFPAMMHYLHRYFAGTSQKTGSVEVERMAIAPTTVYDSMKGKGLCKAFIHTGSLEACKKDAMLADFANEYIGGGVLGYRGAVQEERFFAENPECLAAIYTCKSEAMGIGEVIFISGTERYSELGAYGGGSFFKSDFRDNVADSQACVVAMDAKSYRKQGYWIARQDRNGFYQNFVKAVAAFSANPRFKDKNVSTGLWGCGDFRNDPELMFVAQLMACSMSGNSTRTMNFSCYNDSGMQQRLQALYLKITQRCKNIEDIQDLIENYFAYVGVIRPIADSRYDQRSNSYLDASNVPFLSGYIQNILHW